MIRAVVFDCFGTLMQINNRVNPYLRLLRFYEDKACFKQMVMGTQSGLDKLFPEATSEVLSEVESGIQTELESISLFPDVLPVIGLLREHGVSVAICSNLSEPYRVRASQLLDSVEYTGVWSCTEGLLKPNPQMYRLVCDRLGMSPDEVLMIGDSLRCDVEGPKQIGMQSMHLVRSGSCSLIDVLMKVSEL